MKKSASAHPMSKASAAKAKRLPNAKPAPKLDQGQRRSRKTKDQGPRTAPQARKNQEPKTKNCGKAASPMTLVKHFAP
jgi:hypothetical protein